MKLYIDFYSATPKSPLQKYNGGGKNVRIMVEQISDMNIPDLEIVLFCPEWYEVSEETEPVFCNRKNILFERTKYMTSDYLYEEGSIIFNPVLCLYRDFKEIIRIKKKNPNSKVCAKVHDLRVIDYVFDYTEKYFFSGIKKLIFPVAKLVYEGVIPQIIYKPIIRRCLTTLDEVYTASNFSMQHILRISPETNVKWHYQPIIFDESKVVTQRDKAEKEYILFVSGGRRLKNVGHAMLGFAKYKKKNPDSKLKLIITGLDENRFENLCKLKGVSDLAAEESIIRYGYVENDELEHLYQNCRFVLYMSKLEGFGLPVLEAASYGKTCVASNATSIPEVLASAVRYASPLDDDGIARQISYLCDDDNLRRYEERVISSLAFLRKRMDVEQRSFLEDVLDMSCINFLG
ncbi:MAG: glycosyltransferase [Lachnospiraceae bacterium]|nr:glycosyltransferase [Lachnospiraceae bacterium]